MSRPPQCLDCKFADWKKTTAGRLHPSGDGRCKWEYPEVRLPISLYFYNDRKPSGGHISRKAEWKQCPQYQREG